VKAKYRFVLRVLLYSVPLYLIGQKLLWWYAGALPQFLVSSGPHQHLPGNIGQFLYAPSMAVIAFCALSLATPGMSVQTKAGMVCVGIVVFVLTDVLAIQCIKGAAPLSEDSVVFELYLCVKSLLACVLWIVMSLPYLGELLRSGERCQS